MKKALFAAAMTAMIAGAGVMSQAVPLAEARIDISGFAQMGYTFGDGGLQQNDQLQINRSRIKLIAVPSEKVKLVSQFEFAKVYTDPSNVNGSTHLLDLYAVLDYFKPVEILAGQIPAPFAYEATISPYNYELISSTSMASEGLVIRERGLAASYPINDMVTTKAWVSNGGGQALGSQYATDDRNDYGAMVEVKPVDNFSFKIVAHKFNESDKVSEVGSVLTNGDGTAFGGGFKYNYGAFAVTAEYGNIDVDVDNILNARIPALVAPGIAASVEDEIWYFQASYKVPDTNLQLVGRYDSADKVIAPAGGGASIDSDRQTTILGVNWDFDKNARLQLERSFIESKGLYSNYDKTKLQLAVKF